MLWTDGRALCLACTAVLLSRVALAAALDAAAALRAGDAAFSRSEYFAAVRHFSEAIDADATSAMLLHKRASAHISLGDHAAGARDLSAALELEPSSIQFLLQRGRLHRDLCEFAAAGADFAAIQKLRPGHKTAEKELQSVRTAQKAMEAAQKARQAGDVKAARAHLAAVFEAAALCVGAKLLEAAVMLEDRDYGGVVAMTGQVLKAEPGNAEALLLRSRAYFMLNDLSMSKRHLAEVLKYDDGHAAARAEFKKIKDLIKLKEKAEKASKQRKWAEAEDDFIKALWVEPTANAVNLAFWLGLCQAQLALKKGAEAVKSCTAAADLEPDEETEGHVLKVRALMLDEQFDAAVADARALAEQHRGNHAVHEVLREAEKAKKMSERKDYYKILSLDRSANIRDIKRAYRDLARITHPDKVSGDGPEKEAAQKQFMDIAEAYEILSDEEKRGRYDRGEDLQQGQGGNGGFHRGFHQQQHFHFQQQNFHFQHG